MRLVQVVATLIFLFAGLVPAAQGQRLTPEAARQIGVLLEEKASRTPEQQKIDSALVLEVKRRRGDPLFQRLPQLRSRVSTDAGARVLVDIRAEVTDALLRRIEAGGGEVLSSHPELDEFESIRAWVPLMQLEGLARAPQVRSIRQAARAILNKTNTSQGDVAHAADQARSTFGVDGTGIQIGVLSDGADSVAARQGTGDLPGTVTILPGQAGAGDEGTAMLEIVFDLAPGADLFFATAFSGQPQFAQNILDLQAAGCDVIVDDVFYLSEPTFQDGVIAEAVNTVTAAGALYFSSAGNSGNLNDGASGVWEGDFSPIAAPLVVGGTGHDFGGGDALNNIDVDPPFAMTLQWSDSQGTSNNDYDLYLLDNTGTSVLASSTDIQNGIGNDDFPFEGIDSELFNDTNLKLVVLQNPGAANRYLHLNLHRGQLQFATDGQTSGHAAAADAFGVAAVNVGLAGGGTFDGSETVEIFSSDGPRRVFFQADGTPITPGDFSSTGGEVRQKPDLTAADCVSTATPGFFTFCGTSAAAPHAAALAALMLEGDPSLGSAGVRSIFSATALDIEAPGVDRDSGVGIVDALAAQQIASSRVLTVTKTGDGTGSVTSSPAGIDCGGDCEESYVLSSMIDLTATPDSSSSFVTWSGDCSGAVTPTAVSIDAAKICTAEFGCLLGDVDLILPGQTISTVEPPFTACHSITSGAGGFIVDATGDVTFQAGQSIVLESGFEVQSGGTFTAVIGFP